MGWEQILLICLAAVVVIEFAILVIIRVNQSKRRDREVMNELRREISGELRNAREDINRETKNTLGLVAGTITNSQRDSFAMQNDRLKQLEDSVHKNLQNANLNLERIRADNNEKLEKMRETVDEKLQKTLEEKLGQSFKLVNDQLQEVYKGLGEMQTLASGVGDLKKVLSNVKTRGVLGEIQLESILEQVLSPEQYEKNVATREGSRDRVEFAVKMPGEDAHFVYLPIDAKFPLDLYSRLMDAYDTSDNALIDAAAKQLCDRIRQEAKKIRELYIEPPYTTEFGIMFLPTEGLYAEIVRRGMIEELQNIHITVAGPTTMSALLNSLQMGFRSLAIQKRSNEMWELLCNVKTEFGRFGETLTKAQKKLNETSAELDDLIGKRTRQMERRLREVTTLPGHEAPIGIEDGSDKD